MPVQGSVHNVQRAPHQTLGTRTRRRGRADEDQSEPASHACAPRNRRASVRYAEDADGCDALSDEAVAQCRDRNGAERTQLQSHACAEHRRRQAIAGSHAGVRRGAVDSMATPTAAHIARSARRLLRDAEQQKYSEIAALVSVTVGRERFRNAEPRFHTAWVKSRPHGPEVQLPLYPRKQTSRGHRGMSALCTWP